MKIARPIKRVARRRRRAPLEIVAAPVILPPFSALVLDEFVRESGLDAKAVLGHALQRGTQDGLLLAAAAFMHSHLERVREVVADSQLAKTQMKTKGIL